MRYIDFDGVILDTEDLLFHEWRKNPEHHFLPDEDKVVYIRNCNWRDIINNSPVINDSIYILKNMDKDASSILTKIHSLEEGYEKIIYLRNNDVKQNVILVPYPANKTEVVKPSSSSDILIDDSLSNLQYWCKAGGYPMFFDKNDTNIDSWGLYNKNNYQRVRKIDEKIKRY